jgi:hypothetical protein
MKRVTAGGSSYFDRVVARLGPDRFDFRCHLRRLVVSMAQIAGHAEKRHRARFRSGLVRRGVCRRTSANAPRRRKAGFRQIGGRKLRPELRLAASVFDATPSRGRSDRNSVSAGQSLFPAGGGCGIRTREGVNPTRFPSLPSAVRRCSDQTAGRPLQASQPIVNPDERPRMRLKLRLALRLNWRDGGPRKIVITPCLQSDGMAVVQCC